MLLFVHLKLQSGFLFSQSHFIIAFTNQRVTLGSDGPGPQIFAGSSHNFFYLI